MKIILFSTLLIVWVLNEAECTEKQGNIAKAYLKYLQDEGKLSESPQNLKTRYQLFKNNIRLITEHNSKQSSYKLGINKFSDLSDKELSQFHGLNSSLLQDEEDLLSSSPSLPVSVPDTVDWVAQGKVLNYLTIIPNKHTKSQSMRAKL